MSEETVQGSRGPRLGIIMGENKHPLHSCSAPALHARPIGCAGPECMPKLDAKQQEMHACMYICRYAPSSMQDNRSRRMRNPRAHASASEWWLQE
eukprot:1160703-Pelagomonas_calceolata.AAC.17